MKGQARTRFAPSPTGHLHIGNARTAIMNWIFARHAQGQFILRIEDTDQQRSTIQSETSIMEDLKWLGLQWDEGPNLGGSFGPYRQSERSGFYQDILSQLLKNGNAYPCYCTPDELDIHRKAMLKKGLSPHYSGKCRNLSEEEKRRLEKEGRIPSYRFRVFDEDEISFEDLIKGKITVQTENIGDFVLLRPGGMPMYNYACVVDDHLMNISHIIRGDDHVSNTPRQLLLYMALGWDVPAFAHIPMILGKDRNRLSKRHGATSVDEYRKWGYLPEALVNFLSLLSWSSESGEEILSSEQLISEFDFARIGKASSIFDVEKLNWMNGVYIRQTDINRLSELALPFLKEAGYPVQSKNETQPIVSALHDKLEKLSEISDKARIFFQDPIPEDNQAKGLLEDKAVKQIFDVFLKETEKLDNWNGEVFLGIMKNVQKETGIKGKQLWMPIRVALTGQCHGPELPRIVGILGLEKCRRFIQKAL